MSAVDELGARVRGAADELPLDLVARAVERLRAAGELLLAARRQADNPGAVPGVAGALERAEHAGHALRTAHGHLAAYLAAIGLGATAAPPPSNPPRPAPEPEIAERAPAEETTAAPAGPDWWARRVAELTDEPPPGERAAGDADPGRLLRRVADAVRGGDRAGLRSALTSAPAAVGLRLAALASPALRQLATDLLGHPPTAADLPRLSRATAGRVRDLLPGLPAPVLDTLLARVCRVAPNGSAPAHPADAPVAGAVLTGVLLDLVRRAPDALDTIPATPPAATGPVPPTAATRSAPATPAAASNAPAATGGRRG